MNSSLNNVFAQLSEPSVAPSAPPDGEDAPPPYTTLPRSPSEAGATGLFGAGCITASPALLPGGAGYVPSGVKLGYMDFVPRLQSKKTFGDDVYETFDLLISRANQWLEEHSGLRLVSVETVTWMGVKAKNIYPDSCSFCRSMNADRTTKFLQGMRIWYFMEVFPNPNDQPNSPVLAVKTFVPLHNEKLDQLLKRANDYLGAKPLGGQILSIESIKIKCPDADSAYSPNSVNPNRCFWKEYPDTTRRYVLCARVYALFGKELPGYESIGYQDFIPDKNDRNAENEGYEIFSDVGQRVSQWLARQQGVRFTNLQTVRLKLKKEGAFEERCMFVEHICANNRSNVFKGVNRRTPYLRILRAYFVVHCLPGQRTEFPAVRMTYRTFSPVQTKAATQDQGPEFENMRLLLDRVNQWLQITGARVYGLETVPVRLTTGGLQMLGPEATYSVNKAENTLFERWIYHIRLFLDGEYLEPPGAISLVAPPALAPMPVLNR